MKPTTSQTEDPLRQDLSKIDFQISWRYLRRNYGPFLGTTFFGFFMTVLVTLTFAILFAVVVTLIGKSEMFLTYEFGLLFGKLFVPFAFIMISAFYGSAYGLAYDVMSSGDEFTQTKNAFRYFKKYWWQYSLLSVVSNWFRIILAFFPFDSAPYSFGLRLSLYLGADIIGIATNILLALTFPALTAQGSLRQAFRENFALLKENSSRVVKTLGKIYVYFIIAQIIITDVYYSISGQVEGPVYSAIYILFLLALGVSYLFTNPMWILISTRLYNSLKYQGHQTGA